MTMDTDNSFKTATHVWCETCREIQLAEFEPLTGHCITDRFEGGDIVCTVCKSIPARLWRLVDPTPPASVESADAGEDDATFLDRMCTHPPVNALSTRELDDIDRLIALARCALTPPSTSTAAGGTDDGWRPISTAPRDGSFFLGFDGEIRFCRFNDRSHDYRTNFKGDPSNGYWEWFDHAEGGSCELTHWCRLPPTPVSPAPSAMPSPAVSEADTELPPEALAAWVDYEPADFGKHFVGKALAESVKLRHSFMSGFLAAAALNRLAAANPILPAPEHLAGMERAVEIVRKMLILELKGPGREREVSVLNDVLVALRADTCQDVKS